ncbi:MAG: hypothetical protein ACRDT4_06655 [Micromonosporaceae bacterium]
MTTQNTDEATAGQHTKTIRPIIAFALLGVAALVLLDVVLGLALTDLEFVDQAAGLRFDYLLMIGLPLLAVLIATHVAPVIPQAKAVTITALALYGLAVVFQLLGLVTGLMRHFEHFSAASFVSFVLSQLVGFTLFGIAIFFVLKVFLGAFMQRAATPAFAGYGQQQFSGQQYPTQQPYGAQTATAPAMHATGATAAATATASQAGYAQHGYGATQQAYQQQPAQAAQYGYQQAAQQQAAHEAAQHQAAQQAAQQQAAQQQAAYQNYQAAAPTSAAPASSPPAGQTSSPPASSYAQGQATEMVQPTSGQPAQAPAQTAWPPSPMSTSQWPPTPAAKPAAQASGEDVQHTQVLKPDTFRGGNAGG